MAGRGLPESQKINAHEVPPRPYREAKKQTDFVAGQKHHAIYRAEDGSLIVRGLQNLQERDTIGVI